ncbi:hypothetical protein LWC33_33145 [Pseudonocardia sp. RS11V-5]|uniref:hypothetical protein n=1 Tax=Pseudonocardia terrae TaxID=2905831 RepID=UPI001E3D4C9B|nr:hypothetical protein [Pseudonocardia terrae]MCE3556276.1 hypothetical protein [Pseudonocardia terrae]
MVSGDPRILARRLAPVAVVAGTALLVRGCLGFTTDVAAAAAVGTVIATPPVAVWSLQAGPHRSLARVLVRTGLAVVALVLAGWGAVVTVHGGIGGVLATLAVACLLGAVSRTVRARRPDPPRTRSATRSLPLAELCRQWRLSCARLQRVRDPAELDLVTALRAAYLDEFERRDPEGFRTWTRDDAAGRSDPAGWLRDRSV